MSRSNFKLYDICYLQGYSIFSYPYFAENLDDDLLNTRYQLITFKGDFEKMLTDFKNFCFTYVAN